MSSRSGGQGQYRLIAGFNVWKSAAKGETAITASAKCFNTTIKMIVDIAVPEAIGSDFNKSKEAPPAAQPSIPMMSHFRT